MPNYVVKFRQIFNQIQLHSWLTKTANRHTNLSTTRRENGHPTPGHLKRSIYHSNDNNGEDNVAGDDDDGDDDNGSDYDDPRASSVNNPSN